MPDYHKAKKNSKIWSNSTWRNVQRRYSCKFIYLSWYDFYPTQKSYTQKNRRNIWFKN